MLYGKCGLRIIRVDASNNPLRFDRNWDRNEMLAWFRGHFQEAVDWIETNLSDTSFAFAAPARKYHNTLTLLAQDSSNGDAAVDSFTKGRPYTEGTLFMGKRVSSSNSLVVPFKPIQFLRSRSPMMSSTPGNSLATRNLLLKGSSRRRSWVIAMTAARGKSSSANRLAL